MSRPSTRLVSLALLLAVVVTGCSSSDEPSPAAGPAEPSPPTRSATAEPSSPATSAPVPPAPDPGDALPPVTDRISLPAIMRRPLAAGRIVPGRVVLENDAYVRREVTYTSDGLTISGVLLRPRGPGPFPGIVLDHGYIDPSYYVTGQGLAREQDWLARAGYAVLHTDYRGHAGSDTTTRVDMESRLGYARDAANAVRALAREPWVDGDRMAMLGRSMGGGVTQDVLVAYPDLVDAAVVYASVSSRFVDNLEQFTAESRPAELAAYYDRFGTPEESPEFYRGLSPRTYFDRIEAPVLIHHGTADSTCPYRWSVQTHRLMRKAGVRATLATYAGEEHAFYPQWERSIRRTVRYLRANL